MKICVIGLGYIGLPTAAMFAKCGHQVIGVDKNEDVISALTQGQIIIQEKNLDILVKDVVAQGLLKGSLTPKAADVFIITVPTPISEDKKADMRYVRAASEEITPYLQKGNIVILESTSPVGTVDELIGPIVEKSGLKIGKELFLGHSPERVIPGNILDELVNNSRIAGGINEESAKRIADVYRSFVKGEIFLTDSRTAELCKLAENTYRDINIAYANELAMICEQSNINVWQLIGLCNMHPRVNIHQPGPGVGGHCIAVDPWFIHEKQPDIARLIHQARLINDHMPHMVANKIAELTEGLTNPIITILGVTYKPDVDDVRESPILELTEILKAAGCVIRATDPYAKGYIDDPPCAAESSDLIVLGVNHSVYKDIDWQKMAANMPTPKLLDTRNFIDRKLAEDAGFAYYLLGDQ